jgi:hypothetical protein
MITLQVFTNNIVILTAELFIWMGLWNVCDHTITMFIPNKTNKLIINCILLIVGIVLLYYLNCGQ